LFPAEASVITTWLVLANAWLATGVELPLSKMSRFEPASLSTSWWWPVFGAMVKLKGPGFASKHRSSRNSICGLGRRTGRLAGFTNVEKVRNDMALVSGKGAKNGATSSEHLHRAGVPHPEEQRLVSGSDTCFGGKKACVVR
jgi:hypothetical protein